MKIFKTAIFLAASAMALGISGCLGISESSPSEFYLMNVDANLKPVADSPKCDVNLLPIVAPAYILRPQIVLKESGNVTMLEFNRWAESTTSGFMRTLIEGVSKTSPNASIYAYPAVSPSKNAVSLRVYISECIGELGGTLTFKGRWLLDTVNADGEKSLSKEFSFNIPCGNDVKSYVGAIGASVSALSSEISQGLEELFNQENK